MLTAAHLAITRHDKIDLRVDETRAFSAKQGIAGEIVRTPGRSDDGATPLLDEGPASTGDPTPPGFAPDASRDAVALTRRTLRELGVTRVHPGHGPGRPLP